MRPLSFITSFWLTYMLTLSICNAVTESEHTVNANPPYLSLCFGPAWRAMIRREITKEEYLGHLLAHFRGVRHPEDNGEDRIASFDPVSRSIRLVALKAGYQPMEGKNCSVTKGGFLIDRSGRYNDL